MATEPLSEEQAEALLKTLSEHYSQPVMPVDRYCAALRTWVDQIAWINAPGRSMNADGTEELRQGYRYVEVLRSVLLDINKSNLLSRLIYGGEKLRTRPCPKHEGRWSGIGTCEFGCGETGWLPDPEDFPKERYDKAIDSLEKKLQEDNSVRTMNRLDAEQAGIMKQRAYLFPTEPGTGCDAPFEVKHKLVFSCFYYRLGNSMHLSLDARLDIDTRVQPFRSTTGSNVYRIPSTVLENMEAELRLMFEQVKARLPEYYRQASPVHQWHKSVEDAVEALRYAPTVTMAHISLWAPADIVNSLGAAVETIKEVVAACPCPASCERVVVCREVRNP